jgi:hypothetical protein
MSVPIVTRFVSRYTEDLAGAYANKASLHGKWRVAGLDELTKMAWGRKRRPSNGGSGPLGRR